MSCQGCVKSLRWYHRPLVWVGIVVPIGGSVIGKRGAGNLCDQCRKACIENCRGVCYCNIYTGACYCES